MRRRVVALVVSLVLIAACGAPGIGDKYFPNYGNGGYNVRHYDLFVRYNPATDWLTGTTTITARASEDLVAFNLDLVGLTVRSITVDDARPAGPERATWARDAHELTIVPKHQLRAGGDFVIVVRYGGIPATTFGEFGPEGVFHTDDGLLIEGEPEGPATWFPVNDHPIDKASYTFRVRVPNGYKVVANGVPTATRSAAGWTTNTWEATAPMSSYLATIDVGQWNFNDRVTARGIRIIDAVDPDIAAAANPSLAREEEMLDFLASQFGKYPFKIAGGIVDDHPGIFFALETQTRPIYSSIFFTQAPPPGQGDIVVLHELAHQWYGDSVGLSRWRDIWLNEGFATYAEWLWMEHEGMADAPHQMFASFYLSLPPDNPFWDLPIGNPGPDHLFDFQVYERGAMTLQALRERVGDADFFQILRTWASSKAGGHGNTAQFVALAEQISGRELSGFFRNWLYSVDRPIVRPPLTASARSAAAPNAAAAQQWSEGLAFRLAHGQR
jgi:aminopeptidase N